MTLRDVLPSGGALDGADIDALEMAHVFGSAHRWFYSGDDAKAVGVVPIAGEVVGSRHRVLLPLHFK